MIAIGLLFVRMLHDYFKSRRRLEAEMLVLRHQLSVPDARWRCRIRRTQGGAQRQLQAWPLHRRDNRDSSVAEGEGPRSEGVDQDASRPAVIAMPEPAFTAEPLRAGLVGDELRQTPVLTPVRC